MRLGEKPLVLKVLIFTILIIFSPNLSFSGSKQTSCPNVAERGYLTVLTINLLYPEIEDRDSRLEHIADFIDQHAYYGEPVDIILLQEVVGGFLSETANSSQDLKDLLENRGINYNLRHRVISGIPGILTVGNSILSRCRIIFTFSRTLPMVTERPLEEFEIGLAQETIMARIQVPSFGRINIYNAHLCSFCDPGERLEQAEALLAFIYEAEKFFWTPNPVILGGDFNANLNIPGERPTYTLLTDNGFTDTYAAANDCNICCSESEGYEGCTYALDTNPYLDIIFSEQLEEPIRIDYIFTKGMWETIESSVVFDSCPWVSDHSGVLSKIALPVEEDAAPSFGYNLPPSLRLDF